MLTGPSTEIQWRRRTGSYLTNGHAIMSAKLIWFCMIRAILVSAWHPAIWPGARVSLYTAGNPSHERAAVILCCSDNTERLGVIGLYFMYTVTTDNEDRQLRQPFTFCAQLHLTTTTVNYASPFHHVLVFSRIPLHFVESSFCSSPRVEPPTVFKRGECGMSRCKRKKAQKKIRNLS